MCDEVRQDAAEAAELVQRLGGIEGRLREAQLQAEVRYADLRMELVHWRQAMETKLQEALLRQWGDASEGSLCSHPTGLVKPDDPDANIKFLAAEALHGFGGLVLDASGKRLANDLGRRNCVTGGLWKNKPPLRLCLNRLASEEYSWNCKHYTQLGIMKF